MVSNEILKLKKNKGEIKDKKQTYEGRVKENEGMKFFHDQICWETKLNGEYRIPSQTREFEL